LIINSKAVSTIQITGDIDLRSMLQRKKHPGLAYATINNKAVKEQRYYYLSTCISSWQWRLNFIFWGKKIPFNIAAHYVV